MLFRWQNRLRGNRAFSKAFKLYTEARPKELEQSDSRGLTLGSVRHFKGLRQRVKQRNSRGLNKALGRCLVEHNKQRWPHSSLGLNKAFKLP